MWLISSYSNGPLLSSGKQDAVAHVGGVDDIPTVRDNAETRGDPELNERPKATWNDNGCLERPGSKGGAAM